MNAIKRVLTAVWWCLLVPLYLIVGMFIGAPFYVFWTIQRRTAADAYATGREAIAAKAEGGAQ